VLGSLLRGVWEMDGAGMQQRLGEILGSPREMELLLGMKIWETVRAVSSGLFGTRNGLSMA